MVSRYFSLKISSKYNHKSAVEKSVDTNNAWFRNNTLVTTLTVRYISVPINPRFAPNLTVVAVECRTGVHIIRET